MPRTSARLPGVTVRIRTYQPLDDLFEVEVGGHVVSLGSEGLNGVKGERSYRLSWDPASDPTTPRSAIVYDIFYASSPGGEDFAHGTSADHGLSHVEGSSTVN